MKIAVVVLQGMGKPSPRFYEKLEKNLRKYFPDNINEATKFFPVNYQASFQDQQTQLWVRMIDKNRKNLRQRLIRKFLLNYFSDAVTYESEKETTYGVYQRVHYEIYKVLEQASQFAGEEGKLVVFTYSLGCQVFSNYTWDLQKSLNGEIRGIWKNHQLPVNNFLKLKTLRYWFSCGCNIPLFVSGLEKIEAIEKPNNSFEWINFFDRSDVLGWPLKPLSTTGANGVVHGYNELVEDIQLKVGWWLMSHVMYWRRNRFIKRVAAKINAL